MFRLHRGVGRAAAHQAAVEMLARVGIPAAKARALEYPHQLSGGMRQRVVIVMALACEQGLLFADEPTTALDVTAQAQILELIRQQQAKRGCAILLITHELGVVAETADWVAVMYAERIVERGAVRDVIDRASHPYTRVLIAAVPEVSKRVEVSNRPAPLREISGMVPSLIEPQIGCAFAPRCERALEMCRRNVPALESISLGHDVACHHPGARLP